MRTRKLGWTDLNLTAIGLGTWAMGGGDWKWSWGPQNDQESIAAVLRKLELGINWIDTAPVYGLGHSEEVVGQALKKLAKKPIIATKCSLIWDKDKNISNSLKKASVQAEVEAGKIRYAGVCNFGVEQLKRVQPIHPVASLQPPLQHAGAGRRKRAVGFLCRQQDRRGGL